MCGFKTYPQILWQYSLKDGVQFPSRVWAITHNLLSRTDTVEWCYMTSEATSRKMLWFPPCLICITHSEESQLPHHRGTEGAQGRGPLNRNWGLGSPWREPDWKHRPKTQSSLQTTTTHTVTYWTATLWESLRQNYPAKPLTKYWLTELLFRIVHFGLMLHSNTKIAHTHGENLSM